MNTIAIFSVIIGILSSVVLAFDINKNRQSMSIMNTVWILTGLWAGVLALIAYFWFGREKSLKHGVMTEMSSDNMSMHNEGSMKMDGMRMSPKRKGWQSITLSTLHCGAGCTLADLIGEWFLYFVVITIGGSVIFGSVVIDYILALGIGVYFQYAAIKSMFTLPRKKILLKAFKADVLSLTAWQIGMYGFMAIALFVIFASTGLSKASFMFWFMMQIAMLAGFMVSFPVNIVLIKSGIKRSM